MRFDKLRDKIIDLVAPEETEGNLLALIEKIRENPGAIEYAAHQIAVASEVIQAHERLLVSVRKSKGIHDLYEGLLYSLKDIVEQAISMRPNQSTNDFMIILYRAKREALRTEARFCVKAIDLVTKNAPEGAYTPSKNLPLLRSLAFKI